VRKGFLPWDWLSYGHGKKSHGLITPSTFLIHNSYDSFLWHQYEWIYSSQNYIYVVIYFNVIRKIYLEEKYLVFTKNLRHLSLTLTYHCFRINSCTVSISVFSIFPNYRKSTLQIPYIRSEVQCILKLSEPFSEM
jgi:hypothetical protein